MVYSAAMVAARRRFSRRVAGDQPALAADPVDALVGAGIATASAVGRIGQHVDADTSAVSQSLAGAVRDGRFDRNADAGATRVTLRADETTAAAVARIIRDVGAEPTAVGQSLRGAVRGL